MGPALECDWSTRGHLSKETWLSISLWLPNANGTSGCNGISFPPCLTYAGLWRDWNLPRFSANCQKYREFICASSLLDPENTLTLMLSTKSAKYNHSAFLSSLSLGVRCHMSVPVGLRTPQCLLLFSGPVEDLCVNYHLLQGSASPKLRRMAWSVLLIVPLVHLWICANHHVKNNHGMLDKEEESSLWRNLWVWRQWDMCDPNIRWDNI